MKNSCLAQPRLGADAATVLRQIAGWFDDYNESHPHSGLTRWT
jgi:Integrase core domain